MKNNLYNGIKERLFYTLGKRPEIATSHDFYMALSYAVRDQMMTYWLDMPRPPQKEGAYLSAESIIAFFISSRSHSISFSEFES